SPANLDVRVEAKGGKILSSCEVVELDRAATLSTFSDIAVARPVKEGRYTFRFASEEVAERLAALKQGAKAGPAFGNAALLEELLRPALQRRGLSLPRDVHLELWIDRGGRLTLRKVHGTPKRVDERSAIQEAVATVPEVQVPALQEKRFILFFPRER
ncbi:MAG: hypothetical protein HY815_12100, partial [Candidatus Riflebacteria bacterium]|nr:hypothetical protein [Candidatus Riflebacteria bacterium]